MNKSKKMSFWFCLFMSVGSIIGAGIFSKTPLVIRLVGNGVVWGFIFAAFFVFLKTIPEVVLTSALPANGAAYMHLTRLVHPIAGIVHAINQVVSGTMTVAILSLTFSTFFAMIVPNLNSNVVGIAVALIFTIISMFGVRASSVIQNGSVVALLIAIGIFIFKGIGGDQVLIMDVITMKGTSTGEVWAAMGLLHGSLIGANVLMYAADEIEEPGKTIPIVFMISTLICAIIFALMSYTALANISITDWQADWNLNMADAAAKFLPTALLNIFIVGGPLLAVVTSITAIILMFSRSNMSAARDGLFPESLSRLNKWNCPTGAIWMNTILAIIFMVSGFNLNDLMLISSVPSLLLTPIIFIGVFMLPKKYPNCYKSSFLSWIPHKVNCVIVVISSIVCWLLGYYIFDKMETRHWLSMVIFYTSAGVYSYIRYKYLLSKGKDMLANMRQPYEPWQERENGNVTKAL